MTPGLRFIFGEAIDGDTREDAVKQCDWSFVRSRSQLSLVRTGESPTGHKMTAWEAWSAYGWEVIDEVVENGGAVLRKTEDTPEASLRNRCDELGVAWSTVVEMAGLSWEEQTLGEGTSHHVPIRALGSVAFALGLDERFLSYRDDCGDDSGLAGKLSALRHVPGRDRFRISGRDAVALAECVSVMRVQHRLESWLGKTCEATSFRTSDDYGADAAAARQFGYVLAKDVRERLGLGVDRIDSMKDLVQGRLGLPIVSTELSDVVAGVTVSSVDHAGKEFRGVLVNSVGLNEDVWVSRVTLARELGHALFDPDARIEEVQVDRHMGGAEEEATYPDLAKQRADAFALAFLAPKEEVERVAPLPLDAECVSRVMRDFGMCESAARRRIASCYSWDVPVDQNVHLWAQPSEEDVQAETLVWSSSLPCPVKQSRGGQFREVVVDCFKGRLISGDTAALYLGCSAEEVAASAAEFGA